MLIVALAAGLLTQYFSMLCAFAIGSFSNVSATPDYSNNNNNQHHHHHDSKAQFEIFDNLLTVPRTVSNMYAQVARVQSCANHVQHIKRLSRATCSVAGHMVRMDSSAVEFNRV